MNPVRFDLERARRETRGCGNVVHLNNAGAALMPMPVCDAVNAYLQEEERQGGYEVMAKRADELENFYQTAGRLLNCSPEEIAFVDSATRGWSLAFYAFDLKPGDRILTGSAEYGSNLIAMLHQAKRRGVEIVVVPDDEQGQIDVNALQQLIDEKVKLIAMTHIPSGGGLVNPAEKIGKIARQSGIPYLLDACQSIGQLSLDVEELGCDILCGTGRKFLRGPRGTGLLYIRKGLLEQLEPPMLNHHAGTLLSSSEYQLQTDSRRFECWERNYAGQLGLGVAIDYAIGWGLDVITSRISSLAAGLRQELVRIPGVEVHDRGEQLCGIITFSCKQIEPTRLQQLLAVKRINITSINFTANPIQSEQRRLPELARVSVHYYNSEEELQYFLEVLSGLIKKA